MEDIKFYRIIQPIAMIGSCLSNINEEFMGEIVLDLGYFNDRFAGEVDNLVRVMLPCLGFGSRNRISMPRDCLREITPPPDIMEKINFLTLTGVPREDW